MLSTIRIENFEMDYCVFGSGKKNMVILPGLSIKNIFLSYKSVESAYKMFTEKYTVYLFAARKQLPEEYPLELMAEDIAKAMKIIGVNDAYIFGASRGGMIAQLLAAYHPELVKKAILASSFSRNNATSLPIFNKWIRLAKEQKTDELVEDMVNSIYSDSFVKLYGNILKTMFGDVSKTELENFVKEATAALTFDSLLLRKMIKCPVLVIGTYGDKVLTGEGSLELAGRLGAELYMYDKTNGHAVYDEDPEYKNLIMDFFENDRDTIISLSDIKYGPHERNILDIAYPESAKGNVNLLLMIHGGGWRAADKEIYTERIRNRARNGIVAAAINYRYVSESVCINDIMDDIELSLHKIKSEMADKGINIQKVLFTGISAGAHLSLLYANSRQNSSPVMPVGVVSFCGPADLVSENSLLPFIYDNDSGTPDDMLNLISLLCGKNITANNLNNDEIKKALESISPVCYINKNSVPAVICHGMVDKTVPYENALNLDKAYTENGVEHELISYPNCDHSLGKGKDSDSVMKAELGFQKYIDKFLKQ